MATRAAFRNRGFTSFLLFVIFLAASGSAAWAVERFPPPDFANHALPETVVPSARAGALDYLDVVFLTLALAAASYLALRQRSRKGLFVLTILSLLWLGFWRKGCVCPIGSIQNVALGSFDSSYVIPFSVMLFFALPLLFTLFFGRTFCAAVCPLGAVQELVSVRPVKLPGWLEHTLGLLPFVYLGAAVVFAATGTAFLICQYDPFVGFFRFSLNKMAVVGLCFLVVGVFIGRPYCRFLCPYGALLGLASRVSKYHVRIPPEECINCRLCEDACPYGAIREPTVPLPAVDLARGRRRLAALLLLLPVLIVAGVVLGDRLAIPFSNLHPAVRLAELVRDEESRSPDNVAPATEQEKEKQAAPSAQKSPAAPGAAAPGAVAPRTAAPTGDTKPADMLNAFRNTGRPTRDLYADVVRLRERFAWAGRWLGAWLGLVIGVKLIHLSIRRRRSDYQPDRANCVACGRCFWYCPCEQVRLGLIDTLPSPSAGPSAAAGAAPGANSAQTVPSNRV